MDQQRSFLLFSSVGDSYDTAIENWRYSPSKALPSFDLIFVYYGDDIERFAWLASKCDRIYWHKGSKFQNFIRLYQRLAFFRYDYVWVVDDDISLNVDEINSLFFLTSRYNLAVSQPSLSRFGVISYPIQIPAHKTSILRYTNFIEVTCPVLSRKAASMLFSIAEPFSDILTCYGLDIMMSHYIHGLGQPFAIIDAVKTRNPYPIEKKGGLRECLKMADEPTLRRNWEVVRPLLPSPIPPMDTEIFEYESVFDF